MSFQTDENAVLLNNNYHIGIAIVGKDGKLMCQWQDGPPV